jgi:hypothetical protein
VFKVAIGSPTTDNLFFQNPSISGFLDVYFETYNINFGLMKKLFTLE